MSLHDSCADADDVVLLHSAFSSDCLVQREQEGCWSLFLYEWLSLQQDERSEFKTTRNKK